MYTGSKKMLNIYILKILQQHSDENHRLTQQQIIDYLNREYGMECERKAVTRNIAALTEDGCDIVNDKGWYLVSRDFEDAELSMLIDGLFCSKYIERNQCAGLIDKLSKLASPSFSAKAHHVSNLSNMEHIDNQQVFFTIEVLKDAIERENKVAFYYNTYGLDKQLHHKKEIKYVVSPYQIVSANGRYYLICKYSDHSDAHMRLDRITDIELLNESIEPMQHELDLPKHMAEHVYMCSGDSVTVRMRVNADKLLDCNLMGEMIDWFGKNFDLTNEKNGFYTVKVRMNEKAMFYWAMQYGEFFEILEPQNLRGRIKNTVKNMAARYEKED